MCPILWLNEKLTSAYGELMQRAVTLCDALDLRFHLTLDDVSAEEFLAIRIIHRERYRKQHEDYERQRRENEMKQARSRFHG